MSQPVMVLIEVQGGLICSVKSGVKLDVVVVDYDNIEQGDPGPDELAFANGWTAQEFMDASFTLDQYCNGPRSLDAIEAMETADLWGSHSNFPRTDWQSQVAAGDVQSGYWEWVRSQIEQAEGDKP